MKKGIGYLSISLALLLWGSVSHAAFNLSGSTITQTGTDTDLSGLAGVGGVTTLTSGSGSNIFTTYHVGDRQLRIEGTLTLDPTKEQIIFGNSAPANTVLIPNGGVFNFGIDQTINGEAFQTTGKGLIIPRTLTACCSNGALTVQSGGTLNWKGATLQLASVMNWDNGSTVSITNGKIINTRGSLVRIRSYSTALNVDGLVVEGGDSIDFFRTPVSFSGYQPGYGDRSTEAVSAGAGGSNDPYVFNGYKSTGLDYDFSVWDGSDIKMVSIDAGSAVDMIAGPTNVTNSIVRIYKEVVLKIVDDTGNGIEGVKVFIRDTDNGSRSNVIPRSGANYTVDQDKTYLNTTNATGDISSFEVLTAFKYPSTTIRNENGYNYMSMITDRRGKNNDNNDTFDIHLWGYSKIYSPITRNLKGEEVLTLNWTLFDDAGVTESDKSIVDAYTSIDSLDRFYDRAKSYKVDNVEYPTIGFQVVDANGAQLNLGSKNLIIDATAGAAFVVDEGTHTITMNANTMNCTGGKFTSLLTAGTVTFQNGATPGTCIFTDTNGTNGVLTLTGLNTANVLVYDDGAVGDDTISYQTSQSGTITVPFNATSSTDYQVVVRRQGYSEANFSFDPSSGGAFEFPINQNRALTIEGTPIYQNGGDVAKITMDYAGKKINIGDFTIGAQELYDTLQDLEVTEVAMKSPRISNYDGNDKVLLLNGYQFRNRDGGAAVPGVNAFVFAETGGVLDNSNGSVQFLTNDSATVDRQEQIINMLELIQGSAWDNNSETYATPEAHLVNIVGTGFDPATDSLSNLVQSMLDAGIIDVNTIKDLLE